MMALRHSSRRAAPLVLATGVLGLAAGVPGALAAAGHSVPGIRGLPSGVPAAATAPPSEDHMVFSVQNDFTPADSLLGNLDRVRNPGSFTFTWYPDLVGTIDHAGPAGQIGPTSDYWISRLAARSSKPGTTASVKADSAAIRQPAETPSESYGASPLPEPTPAVTDVETWKQGPAPATKQTLTLGLTNVATAAVDMLRAGLRCAAITVSTDGATALTLLHLKPGSAVTAAGSSVASAGAGDSATVELAKGTTVLSACSRTAG